MKKKRPSFENGTRKIRVRNKRFYEKQDFYWKCAGEIPENIREIIKLYQHYNNLPLLYDSFDPYFFKGHLDAQNKISGERIRILPNGKELARAGFSLFAKNLKINLDDTVAWDVIYENSSGLKTYLYSLDKIKISQQRKKELVDKFRKYYPKIRRKLNRDLKEKGSIEYLALYFLLNTYIRIGNHYHYQRTGHKGLTTLQKKDVEINPEKRKLRFRFTGKDGVPQDIKITCPPRVFELLKNRLDEIGEEDFVFAKTNRPLHSDVFSKILYQYTGEHFYPHIIRSFYADSQCIKFLEKNKNKEKVEKEEVENVFKSIAEKLGHKKFNKKKNTWEISPRVTIQSYISPVYVTKMRSLYEKERRENL